MFSLFIFSILSVVFSIHRPIVVLHGVLADSASIEKMSNSLREYFGDVHINNIVIGNNESIYSFKTPIINQASEAWKVIQNDRVIAEAGEFDMVGHSQGTMIFRTIIEEFLPTQNKLKVVNFMSLSGPLNGVFCGKNDSNCRNYFIPDFLDEWINEHVYDDKYQKIIAPSNYWKSPFSDDYERMMNSMSILTELDNLKNYKESRKKGFTSVKKIICLWSKNDGIIAPYYSSKWDYFSEDSDNIQKVLPMKEQEIYIKDTFGLRTLDERGDLLFVEFPYTHLDYVLKKGLTWLEKNAWDLLK